MIEYQITKTILRHRVAIVAQDFGEKLINKQITSTLFS